MTQNPVRAGAGPGVDLDREWVRAARVRVARVRVARVRVSDRGSVTVEAAMVLAALVLVAAICLGGLGAVVEQMRCADAAREAARLAGRGDPAGAAAAVAALAPAGALLTLSTVGTLTTATVGVGAFSGLLPGVVVRASATAANEAAPGGG